MNRRQKIPVLNQTTTHDEEALNFLRRLVDHVEAEPPPGLDLALASRARSELARLLAQR